MTIFVNYVFVQKKMQKLLKHFLFLNHKCYYIYNNLLEILKDFYIKMFIIKIIFLYRLLGKRI